MKKKKKKKKPSLSQKRKKERAANKRWRKKNPNYQKEWRKKNPKKTSEYSARYRAKNLEKRRKEGREYMRRMREVAPEKQREYHQRWKAKGGWRRAYLKRTYGITLEQFNQLLASQNGACAICKQAPKGTIHIDHCHSTKKIRGLLCGDCNRAIGLLKDDPIRCQEAAKYLCR